MESLSACTTKMELAVKEEAAVMKGGMSYQIRESFRFLNRKLVDTFNFLLRSPG